MPPQEASRCVSSSDDKALFVLDQTRMLGRRADGGKSTILRSLCCARMHACRTIAASCSRSNRRES